MWLIASQTATIETLKVWKWHSPPFARHALPRNRAVHRCKEPMMSIDSRQLSYFIAVAGIDPENLAHYRLDGH
jgi:hypothetical protein